MMAFSRLLFVSFCCIVFAASCTKPVTVGSDFLDDEKSDLLFADDFNLIFHTIKTDSILTHSDNQSLQLTTFICGNIEDPIFGKYSTEIYAQPVLPTIATQLKGASLDSVVLLMKYDTSVYYGQLNQPVTFEVYQMIENPDFETEYYSNERFNTSPDLLGSATFIPAPKDSVTVITGTDTVRAAPHIRVTLDRLKFGSFTSQDTSVYTNLDTFLAFFNGLHIKMTGATNTMLGLDLTNTLSGLLLYYNKETVTNAQFKFLFSAGAIKSVYMHHDYSGSIVGNALTPDPELDFWYVQGLSGVTSTMEIEDLNQQLGSAIINNAELELFCTFPDGDEPLFYKPIPYIISQEKTDTSLIPSIDVRSALTVTNGSFRNNTYRTLYGGDLRDTISGPPVVYRYNLRVTNQIKQIYLGNKENVIYFNPILKGNVPNRTVFFGPNHPVFAPRLRVSYTRL